jgi:copper(I)-binding protein
MARPGYVEVPIALLEAMAEAAEAVAAFVELHAPRDDDDTPVEVLLARLEANTRLHEALSRVSAIAEEHAAS